MRTLSSVSMLLASVLLLVACGGGSGGREVVQQTLNLPGVGTNSGTIVLSSGGSVFFPTSGVNPNPGDTAGNGQQKGYLRFDHSSIPAGARVLSATLIITQEPAIGTPYSDLNGPVLVDHVQTGATLDMDDWVGGTLGAAILTLATAATPGTTTHDVTQAVALDVASQRATTDFRFYFAQATDAGSDDDQAVFLRPGQLNEPRLEIVIEFTQ